MLYSWTALHCQKSMSLNFLVFQVSAGIFFQGLQLFGFLIFFFNTASSFPSVNCPSWISSWPLMIFGLVCQWFQEGVRADPSTLFSNSDVFLLGRKYLVLLSMYSSFCSLHLLSAMLFVIVYRISNFIDLALNSFLIAFWHVLVSSF